MGKRGTQKEELESRSRAGVRLAGSSDNLNSPHAEATLRARAQEYWTEQGKLPIGNESLGVDPAVNRVRL
jgi:hypothetical protein